MSHCRTCLVGLALLACLVLAPAPAHAAESLDTCAGFIDTVPTVISKQGVWCLRHDLSTAITSGNAITIEANNVAIDCNDFKLGGLAAGAGTNANGIYAINRLNATVRHCNVRGFRIGVVLEGISGGGHVVEDNRLDGNTFVGLEVYGDGSVVGRNRVNDTGGPATSVYGIATRGAVDVLDNTVSGVFASRDTFSNGSAYGIYVQSNPGGSVSGNRVRGLDTREGGTIQGISSPNAGRISLRGNDLSGDGSANSRGLYCANNDGRASDNIVNGFVTSNVNCLDAGGNSF